MNFFVTVLFKSGSGMLVVENNHSEVETAGLVFFVLLLSTLVKR